MEGLKVELCFFRLKEVIDNVWSGRLCARPLRSFRGTSKKEKTVRLEVDPYYIYGLYIPFGMEKPLDLC